MGRKRKIINDTERISNDYFKDISNFSPLTKEEEASLWEKYKKYNDLSARDKIITSNLKFVATVARPYIGMGLSYSDLIAEGNIGLMKAIDKFDYEKGYKTISYSVWWIRQTILDALNKRNVLNGDDSDLLNEIIDKSNDDDNIPNEEFDVSYMENFDPFIYNCDNDINFVSLLLDCLDNREKLIITNYYGLNDQKELTLEDIGKKMNLTKERIRQIKETALKKLRTEVLKRSITKEAI